ncbi:hypothetical protein THRCLA_10776 [Thraustotheca clavata]|uniref:Aminotransferase class V domain-containing protein n=1 Tax=Thraustotheca clavata TaxID=74557 RepID=A0A1V9YHC0_9STRA|nr:hypothetical protein THRCLA_10776 [Thraustotheca clavata]
MMLRWTGRRAFSIKSSGYSAIGSFHTPSIDDIFQLDEIHLPVTANLPSEPSLFGNEMRKHFFLDPSWTFINHGAFGASLRVGMDVAQQWREYGELQPLKFYDRELFFYMVDAIQELAHVLHATPKDVVLLPNATAGLNAVIQSIALTMQPGESIYSLDVAYGAVKKLINHVCQERKLVHESHRLTYSDSHNDDLILSQIEKTLPKEKCRLVVIDHITSNTATLLPVERIVQLCHSRGIPVLVDGAHGLLNLPLDLSKLQADYYVGNCHKWLGSPKGAAFLHVQPQHQKRIRPQIQSHGMNDGFQSSFMWTGLQDYSSLLSLPACLSFWAKHDFNAVRKYIHSTVDTAAILLEDNWKTSEGYDVPAHKKSSMRLVALPAKVFKTSFPATSNDAKLVQDALHFNHQIEVPVKCIEGRLYVRISCHVYNTMEDYEKLNFVIKSQM